MECSRGSHLSYFTCFKVPLTKRIVIPGFQIISAIHRRFPTSFTPNAVDSFVAALTPPSRATLAGLPPEQREKEDAARLTKQRPVLRVCSELALVGIIRDSPGRSGGEWVMKVLKDLVRFFSVAIFPSGTNLLLHDILVIQRPFSFLSATLDYFSQILLPTILGDHPATDFEDHHKWGCKRTWIGGRRKYRPGNE